MKVIIAGSRVVTDYEEVLETVADSGFIISEVVSGTAKGVDRLGERLAQEFNIPLKQFPADWDRYGKGAGHKRNTQMAEYADALIAIWDGVSLGTKNMINTAKQLKLRVHIGMV